MTRMTDTKLTNCELDAWIAENVMGWKALVRGNWSYWVKEDDSLVVRQSKFQPTEDRNAAALVLERIYDSPIKLSFILVIWNDANLNYADTKAEIGWAFLQRSPRQLMEAVKKAWENRK